MSVHAISESKLAKLDQQLRELALTDWPAFCAQVQLDVLQAFVCSELEKGKSLRQIAQAAHVTRSTVERRCKKCPDYRDRK